MDKYILINCTEDGDKYFTTFENKEILNKVLNEMLEENITVEDFIPEYDITQNMNYMQGYILIKGEVVIPKIVKEVTKLEI